MQHQKNSHGDQKTRHAEQSFDQQQRASKSSSTDATEHEDVPMELVQVPGGDTDRNSDMELVVERPDVCSGGLDKLKKKLRDLKATRAEINQDIATLERALGLVEDNSS
jgi:hypothetical protein